MRLMDHAVETVPVARYKRAVGSLVARVDTFANDLNRFECHISAQRVGILQLVLIKSDPLIIKRSLRCISRDPYTQYIFALHRTGRCAIRFENREVIAEAGTFFLLDKTQPYEVEFLERTERLLVCVSRRDLEHRLFDPDRYLLTIIDTGRGLGRIASSYTDMLFEEAAHMDTTSSTFAAEVCLELLATALASGVPSHIIDDERTGRIKNWLPLLSRIRAYIRQNLSNSNLNPETIAKAHGISKRYLHALFASTGKSVGTWTREERLNRAYCDLTNARLKHLSVTTIALSHGFNDVPHFCRQFKTRYQMTPNKAREIGPSRSG